VTCRDLAKLTQPARPDFLKHKQEEALVALTAAEDLARAARDASEDAQGAAKQELEHSIARCEEWGALGAEC
jgi:hypothetical protein